MESLDPALQAKVKRRLRSSASYGQAQAGHHARAGEAHRSPDPPPWPGPAVPRPCDSSAWGGGRRRGNSEIRPMRHKNQFLALLPIPFFTYSIMGLTLQELEEADREWMEHMLKKSWLDAECGQKWLNIEVATEERQRCTAHLEVRAENFSAR